jgi:AmmeMemoRadiSam system protein A
MMRSGRPGYEGGNKTAPIASLKKNYMTREYCTLILGVLLMASFGSDASSENGAKKPSAGVSSPAISQAPSNDELAPDVKAFLLKLARRNLDAAVQGMPPVALADAPAVTKEFRGCFVTLTKKGQLRGCIGYIEGIKPLYQAVIDNAKNAALEDPRFPKVRPFELTDIKVEVSVLTKPLPLDYKDPQDLLEKLKPGEDGIILSKGYHQSTFLPQVWEQLPDKTEFLEHLSMKAGMPADGWKTSEVKRYRAIHFQEN